MKSYRNPNGLLLKVGEIFMSFLLAISIASEVNNYNKMSNDLCKKLDDFFMSGGGLNDYSPVNENLLSYR
jgi:hypothetical protein